MRKLSEDLVGLDLSITNPDLRVGESIPVRVYGVRANGDQVELSPADVEFVSNNSGLFVTDNGLALAQAEGPHTVVVSAFGLQTATVVRVGNPDTEFVDVFPESYVLRSDEERSFVVRNRLATSVVDVTADPNTQYVVENPSILSVSDTGFISPIAEGITEVIVIRGGLSYQTEFRVDSSDLVPSRIVDEAGGFVGDATGPILGVPPGALNESTTISIESLSEDDLPYSTPPGFQFAGGAEINGLPIENNYPGSLSIPAPEGSSPGDPIYLFAPIQVEVEGRTESTWLLVDAMVVGEDGRATTTSPPNVGINGRQYTAAGNFQATDASKMFAMAPSLGSALTAMSDLSQRLTTRGNPQFGDYITSMDGDVTNGGDGSQKFYAGHDIRGTFLVPMIFNIPYRVTSYKLDPTGLVKVDDQDITIQPGDFPTLILPALPRTDSRDTPPSIQSGEIEFPTGVGEKIEIRLSPPKGAKFTAENPSPNAPNNDGKTLGSELADLYVTIEVGGRDSFDEVGNRLQIGGPDVQVPGKDLRADGNDIVFDLPVGAQVAGSAITVTRPMDLPVDGQFKRQELTSNPVQILSDERFGAVASARDNSVTIYDVCGLLTPTGRTSQCAVTEPKDQSDKLQPYVRAIIGLIDGEQTDSLAPRKTIASPDGTRFYASLDGTGSIAVIDAVALQQIDVKPDSDEPEKDKSKGVNTIELPAGAKPFEMVIDSSTRRMYVTDQAKPMIYVIDVDEYSPTYHKALSTISIPDSARGTSALGRIGLRGIAISEDDSRIYAASPRNDAVRSSGSGRGAVVSIRVRDAEGELIEVPEFDERDPLSVTEVGPGPYDVTTTSDPDVVLVADRVSDNDGLTILRRTDIGTPNERFVDENVSFVDFGAIPRLVEGRGTQVHGVSNAQSVSFVAENQFEDVIGVPHPSYALVTGARRFKVGDSKTDPSLGPFFTFNPTLQNDAGVTIKYQISAGGNIGFIRNPLGDPTDDLEKPRLVAATTPIIQGFTDDLAIATQSGLLLAAHPGADIVTGHDLPEMIRAIEDIAQADEVAKWSQFPEDPAASGDLSALLRGALSTVPIDLALPPTAVAADYRYFFVNGQLNYGVPPKSFNGLEPNPNAPLFGGDMPRGVSVQPAASGDLLSLTSSPYNQTPSMLGFPHQPMHIEAGVEATGEIHSGALHERHSLVSYKSLEQERGAVLHYDSLRADPRPVYHVNLPALDKQDIDISSDRFGYRLTAIDKDGARYVAEGMDEETAAKHGLEVGTNLYKFPKAKRDTTYGAGLQIDLTEADTGLYTLEIEYGLLRGNGDLYSGRMITDTVVFAHVNETKSPFGAGWGYEGYVRLYPGDAGALLVDGNGQEQIFLSPEEEGQPFTPTVNDYSLLTVSEDGFRRRLRDGTVQEFDSKGRLQKSTDRNGNTTTFQYVDSDSDKLSKIIDPVGLETKFNYVGDRVSSIVNPAERSTVFSYDGKGNLTKIVDPDGATRTFDYNHRHPTDQNLGIHLLTGQTFPRGNDPNEENGEDFAESYQYGLVDGRLSSGIRVDGKSFTIEPAQVGFLDELEERTTPSQSPELRVMSSSTSASVFEFLDARCSMHDEMEPDNNTGEMTTETTYTASAKHTDFRGKDHTYAMTSYGQYEDTTESRRNQTQFGRSPDGGRITAEIDPVGNIICYVRDDFGNITRQTDFPDGTAATRITKYDYDPEFNFAQSYNIPVEVVDEVGRTISHKLDGSGNIFETTITDPNAPEGSPDQVTQSFSYLENGLIDIVRDGNRNETDSDYDQYGRLITTKFDDGSTTYIYNDLTGFISEEIDANGNRIIYTRDAMNRVLSVRHIGDEDREMPTLTATMSYDAHGNVVREQDRDDDVTTRSYDVLDRPSRVVADAEELAYETLYAYDFGALTPDYPVSADGEGDVHTIQHPTGYFTVAVYNEFNELTGSYDELGRFTKVERDDAGRITEVTPPHGKPIKYTLDGRGRTTEEFGPLPDQLTTTVFDHANRITSKTIKNTTGDQVTSFVYNIFDVAAEVLDAEQNLTRYTFDAAGNKLAETLAADTSEAFTTSWTYDARNRAITEKSGTATASMYTYFPGGQLKTSTDPNSFTTEYLLDTMNRVWKVVDPMNGETITRYLGEGSLSSVSDPRGEEFVTVYKYDGLKRLISETNALDETITYDYDRANRIIATADARAENGTDSDRFVTRSEFDRVGRLVASVDGEGNRTEYDFDDDWDSISAVRTPTPNLDGEGFVESKFEWSSDRRTRTTRIPTGEGFIVRQITTDTLGNELTSTIEGLSVGTETKFDKLNRVVSIIDAPNTSDAVESRIEYDGRGKVKSRFDPLGIETRYEYDDRLFLTKTIEAVGQPEQFTVESTYDDAGNLLRITDPRNSLLATTYTYDALNRRETVTIPFGPLDRVETATTVFTYDAVGNVLTETDPRNSAWITKYTYDEASRLTEKLDARNQEWLYEYDAVGNRIKSIDPLLFEHTYEYDALNRSIGQSDPLGNTSCTVIDAAGNVVAEVMPNAGLLTCDFGVGGLPVGSLSHTTLHEYDLASRKIRTIDAEGFVHGTEYDDASRAIKMIDPRSERGQLFETEFHYDNRDNVIRTVMASGLEGSDEVLIESRTYDKRDSPLTYIDARGVRTDFTYDSLGRTKIVEQQVAIPVLDVMGELEITEYRYDALNNVIETIDPRGEFFNTTNEYDAAGLLAKTTKPTGTPENPGEDASWLYRYDALGNQLEVEDPRGSYFTTIKNYDELGRVDSITTPRGLPSNPLDPAVESFDYDLAGRLIVRSGPLRNADGELEQSFFAYDDAGRQNVVTNALGHVNEYFFDKNGNIEREVYKGGNAGGVAIPDREVNHTYDELDRIITTTDTVGREVTSVYDEVGNLVETIGPTVGQDGNPAVHRRVYDAANRLRSETNVVGDTSVYEYDGAGNRISIQDGRGAFYTSLAVYDGANRVARAIQPTGTADDPGPNAIYNYRYERAGNIRHEIDPRGEDYRTTTVYDPVGSVARIEHPYGRSADELTRITERWEYDLAGNLFKYIDPRGEEFSTEYVYDAQNNILQRSIASGTEDAPTKLTETFTYDEGRNRLTHTGFGGPEYITTFTYDAVGRATSITDAAGDSITWDLDRFGNPIITTDKFGTTLSTFDAANRPLIETDALLHEVSFAYEQSDEGEVVKRTDERGNVWETYYDALGRPIREVDPLGATVRYRYDSAGNPAGVIDGRGNVHLTEFDARNLPVTQIVAVGRPESTTVHHEYDLLGRKTLETDPRDPSGEFFATTFEYDAIGRQIRSSMSAAYPNELGRNAFDSRSRR